MDALALLCTLHADGPSTLQRLKAAGCSSLADLGKLEEQRLIELIESTPAAARRFRREARHLAERVGADWLEREESAEEGAVLLAPQSSQPAAQVPAAIGCESVRSSLPAQDRSILEKVLAQWREADAREPLPAAIEEEPREAEPLSVESLVLESLEPELGEQGTAMVGTALQAGWVDGLDERVIAALSNCGIDTLEAFETAELDQLALHSGIGYSRLDRIRRLMLRAGLLPAAAPLAPQAPGMPQAPGVPEPRDMLVPQLRHGPGHGPRHGFPQDSALPRMATRWEPAQEGAAGPFA
ncbi:MAG: hypothetical protein RL277_2644 [Planctomycetota bacterium]